MTTYLKLAILSGLFALALVMTTSTASAQRGSGGPVIALPKVTAVSLGSPLSGGAQNGGCPQNIMMTASITVSGPCTVKYAWILSDESGAPVYHTMTFDKAGTKQQMLQFGVTSQRPSRQGQLTFSVTAPNTIQSTPYNYNLTCSTGIQVNPNVILKP